MSSYTSHARFCTRTSKVGVGVPVLRGTAAQGKRAICGPGRRVKHNTTNPKTGFKVITPSIQCRALSKETNFIVPPFHVHSTIEILLAAWLVGAVRDSSSLLLGAPHKGPLVNHGRRIPPDRTTSAWIPLCAAWFFVQARAVVVEPKRNTRPTAAAEEHQWTEPERSEKKYKKKKISAKIENFAKKITSRDGKFF